MTFLAPLALIGTLLLIIPIVVHLFKPRKMKETPFSSLRWLKATHQRLSRRVEWHQWLLFLLRAGCILLLVVALARPLIGMWGANRPAERFIIVDASRSMAVKSADQATPMERATALAERYVQASQPGDRTAVIVAGAAPKLLAPPSADASPFIAAIKATKPGLADTSLSASLPLVRSLLPRQGERDVELIFLTDNLQGRWQQQDVHAFLHELPGSVKVKVIETGTSSAHNAWIASARLLQFGADDDRWIHVEVGSVGDSQIARSVRLSGLAGVEDDVQPIALKAGQSAFVGFKLPAGLNLQGQVATVRLEPEDALVSDDVFFLNLDTSWALRVLIVEPETLGADGRNVGLFLRAGMEALAASKNHALEVMGRTQATVTPGDVQKADLIFLAGVPELPDAALESLESRVRAGAGLAVFLGPQLKADFFNQKLYRPQQPAEGLAPLPIGAQGLVDGKPGTLTNVRWSHPLLASLQDPIQSDFTQGRFRIYGQLEGTVSKNDVVLARFDNETPAIVERALGAGRVLMFNTSANDEWSDLPRRKSFVPLLDRMLSYLSAGGLKRNFTVGEAVILPLSEFPTGGEVTVVSPSGATLSPRLLNVRGQTFVHLAEVAEAGAYRIEGADKKTIVFTVNAARADSPLGAMDAKALEAWFAPANVEVMSAESAGQRLDQQSSQWPVWQLLIVLAGCLLIAETIYVHRLCPRANPKAADAVVPERGVLRPVS